MVATGFEGGPLRHAVMRYVNGVFCLVMLLFAAVQYNDPDAFFWIPVYLVPAAWAGVAAVRPQVLRKRLSSLGLTACLALAVVGTVYFWPPDQQWWRQEVWWESEPAREGMGVMIVTVTLLVVLFTLSLVRRRPAR